MKIAIRPASPALVALFVLCSVFASVSFTTQGYAATEKIELKALSFLPAMTPLARQLKVYIDKVNAAPDGPVKIKYIGGPEAIATFEQANAISRGVVDMLVITPSLIAGMVPEAEFTIASRISATEEIKRGAIDKLRDYYAKSNIYLLGRLCDSATPVFYLFTTKKVSGPGDLKGMVLGGTGPMAKPIFDAFGITLKIAPLGDAITVIERKIVEGWMSTATGIAPFGVQEHLAYAIDHPYFYIPNVVLFNLERWKSLSAESRDFLVGTLYDISPGLGRASDEEELKARKTMEQAGVKYIQFSESDGRRFLDTVYDAMWDDWEKKLPQSAPEFRKLLSP